MRSHTAKGAVRTEKDIENVYTYALNGAIELISSEIAVAHVEVDAAVVDTLPDLAKHVERISSVVYTLERVVRLRARGKRPTKCP
jgi:hypothetical protein